MSLGRKSKRVGFGVFLGGIMDELGDNQERFAKRLGYSRPLIGHLIKGVKPPSKPLIDLLMELFPDLADEIESAAKPYRTPERPRHRRMLDSFFHDVEELIAKDRHDDAGRLLSQRARTSTDRYQLAWICIYLSRLPARSYDDGIFRFRSPTDVALLLILELSVLNFDAKIVDLWDELVETRLLDGEPRVALLHLDAALSNYSSANKLWYRRALIYFDEDNFSAAYAALTTASHHKLRRDYMLYLRGQIFAEWGDPRAAIRDFDDLLEADPNKAAVGRIRCARGYALFRARHTRDAITELFAAETLSPRSPWPQYFLGECLYRLAQAMNAADPVAIDVEAEAYTRFQLAYSRMLSPAMKGKCKYAERQLQVIEQAMAQNKSAQPVFARIFGKIEVI